MMKRRALQSAFPLAILISFVMAALFPAVFTGYDPIEINPAARLLGPSRDHVLGTDALGRDIFSRVVYGARASLVVGLGVVIGAAAIGTAVGMVAGTSRGIADLLVMRITDMFLCIPSLILAVAMGAARGPGLVNSVIVLIISGWAIYARLARSQAMVIGESLFVEAAKALGGHKTRIVFRHIWRNAYPTILVQGALDFGTTIIYFGALSFIGLGIRPPAPEWGGMVAEGYAYLQEAWWLPTFPGLALVAVALSANLASDELRDAMVSPRKAVSL